MRANRDSFREPTEAEIEQFLPGDVKAFRSDAFAWTFWLLLASVVRTLLATHPVLYPRALAIGVLMAVVILAAACLVTVRFWPWASRNVQRFADVGGLGFILTTLALEFGADTTLIPWSAAVGGTFISALLQRLRRRRWLKKAKSLWKREMGYM